MRADSVHTHSNSAFRWIYDKEPTHAIFVTAPHFLLPSAQRQLKAAAVHQTTPLLWGSLIVPQKVSNGKADVRSGARICCTKNSRATVAGLQGLEIREMPKTKLKQQPLFSQSAAEAALCKGRSASFSRKIHVKFPINLTRRNMEYHKTEEWAQTLLTCSAPW